MWWYFQFNLIFETLLNVQNDIRKQFSLKVSNILVFLHHQQDLENEIFSPIFFIP